jgi:Amt family ammonium transporter
MAPHNLPFAVTGAAMLWVGWFGFNADPRWRNGLASSAFMATHNCGIDGSDWLDDCRVDHTVNRPAFGAASGAGWLAAITPASFCDADGGDCDRACG